MKYDPADLTTLANYWAGAWAITRRIPEEGASLEGQAVFTPSVTVGEASPHHLHYYEAGKLVLQNGQGFDAERRYDFTCQKDSVLIYFADGADKGKFFQDLRQQGDHPGATLSPSPSDLVLTGHHLCVRDHYRTWYIIRGLNDFEVTHEVKGPAKNYTSTTCYRRLSPSL